MSTCDHNQLFSIQLNGNNHLLCKECSIEFFPNGCKFSIEKCADCKLANVMRKDCLCPCHSEEKPKDRCTCNDTFGGVQPQCPVHKPTPQKQCEEKSDEKPKQSYHRIRCNECVGHHKNADHSECCTLCCIESQPNSL